MKRLIKANKPAYGVSVQFPSAEIVEMIGELGFDWVLLDAEHGSITPDNIGPLIMAAEIRGITPIVRPEKNDPAIINKYLDRGAMGVQVPHVNSADEARAAVNACLYHPQGARGLGGGRMADFGWGAPTTEYVVESNREMLVCIQIEDIEAVENLDEIRCRISRGFSSGQPISPNHWATPATTDTRTCKKSCRRRSTGFTLLAKLRVHRVLPSRP